MSYRNTVKGRGEEVTQERDPSKDPMACPLCKAITTRGALSTYGARCFRCYTEYCRAPQYFPDTGDKRIDGPRGWAHALKRRHEQGDRLTPAQVSAYKAALRTTEEA
jgi:hypothetical protein